MLDRSAVMSCATNCPKNGQPAASHPSDDIIGVTTVAESSRTAGHTGTHRQQRKPADLERAGRTTSRWGIL